MKSIIALAALSFSLVAHADNAPTTPVTYKVVCMVSTYNTDGSNFKNQISSDFTVTEGQRTEVYRSAHSIYSVIANEDDHGPAPYESYFLEIKDIKTGKVHSAAEGEWLKGSPGDHRLTTYSADAEPHVQAMLFCQNAN